MNALKSADCSDERGVEQIAPIDGDSSLSSRTVPGCSRGACDDCSEILHGLNNVLASMLLNAQVMEWKLPSYSRSKRYLHEIERNAQRGGELVKRLLGRLEASSPTALSDGRTSSSAHSLAGDEGAMATDDPGYCDPCGGAAARRSSPVGSCFSVASKKSASHDSVISVLA